MEVEFVPSGKVLGREGNKPDAVVLLRQGSVRVTGTNMPGERGWRRPRRHGASLVVCKMSWNHLACTGDRSGIVLCCRATLYQTAV